MKTDVANVEQVVICLRWVSERIEIYEDFVGLHQVDSTEGEKLYGVIADVLLRLNLKLRGQCYNGAVSMSSGVGCMQAVFTHCTKFSLCRYH